MLSDEHLPSALLPAHWRVAIQTEPAHFLSCFPGWDRQTRTLFDTTGWDGPSPPHGHGGRGLALRNRQHARGERTWNLTGRVKTAWLLACIIKPRQTSHGGLYAGVPRYIELDSLHAYLDSILLAPLALLRGASFTFANAFTST